MKTPIEFEGVVQRRKNLLWDSTLELAGVKVVYDVFDSKTNAKVLIVIRREVDSFRSYCHFGTGNCNIATARIYTDIASARLTRTWGAMGQLRSPISLAIR